MRFKWSRHLGMRMQQRGISADQVQKTLDQGMLEVASPVSLCYRFTFDDGRTLKVWTVVGTKEPRTVKSAAWEDEEGK